MTPSTCHCGKALHYGDKDMQRRIEDIVAKKGEYVPMTNADGRTFLVQRHYVALHGIKEREIERLGFKEVLT